MKWGIIGTGRIASAFAEATRRVPGASIVAVASRTAERADEFARRIGAPRTFSSAAEVASRGDVDVIYVATPHHRHEADALAALAAGKPVLCEKPLAPDNSAGRRIASAARARGVFCMEGLWSLCQPVYREAFGRIEAGEIGEVRLVTGNFSVPMAFDPNSRFWDPNQYGGALLDRGIYLVALALALMPDLTPVSAVGNRAETGVDSATHVVLRTLTGQHAVFSVSQESQGLNVFVVQGTHGRCTFFEPLTCPPGYWLNRQPPAVAGKAEAPKTNWLGSWMKRQPMARRISRALMRGSRWFDGGLHYEIIEVERCLAAGLLESPLVPLDRSLRTLQILDQVAALTAPPERSVLSSAATA